MFKKTWFLNGLHKEVGKYSPTTNIYTRRSSTISQEGGTQLASEAENLWLGV
jgi:hypothetical protein